MRWIGLENMEINLRQLRTVTIRLFDQLVQSEEVCKIGQHSNFYWNMKPEVLYDMSQEPKEFDVGSLADDWEFVSSLLDEKNEPVTYQFTEIAPILRYIGEVLSGSFSDDGKMNKKN